MATATSKILLTVGLKIITPVFKLLKSKLEKKLCIYSRLRKRDAIKISSDFDSIYLETLYQLIEIKKKNKNIISLFEIDEVKDAFKNEIYEKNNWAFEVNLNANLHTNPKLRKLKEIQVNLYKEIFEFKVEFKNVINKTREPKEIETHESITKIRNDVSNLLSTEKLNKKFRTNIELEDQILLSQSEIHPLNEHISNREELIQSLIEDFNSCEWLAINGSVSTGKTQLSVLLSSQIKKSIFWINLREFNSKSFILKLFTDLSSFVSISATYEIAQWQSMIIEKIGQDSLIILDDLPKLDNKNQSFIKFISFLKACNEKEIKILSTSNFELPFLIKDLLPKDFIKELTIPPLQQKEIEEILYTYDLNAEKVDIFKKLINPISLGHPILVKAICEYLIQKNWIITDEEFGNIFRDNYSLELNEDTYEILKKTIPDENTRNLLYRLNIISGAFTTEDVRTLSDCPPKIANSIERFNSTKGLWIQKRDSDNFEISPLLKRLKSKDLHPQLEKKINYTLGKKILDKRKLNQFDASKAIIYFLAAKSFNDAGFVLTLVLKEALKRPELYFEWGINLYWYSTPLPKEMDLYLQINIRVFQIFLNQQENNDISYLISDLENICDLASIKGINVGAAHLLLSNHFATKDSKKALNYLMSGNDQYNSLIKELDGNLKLNLTDNLEATIWGAIVNIKSIEEIDYWFETVRKLTKEQIESLKNSENIDFGSIFILQNLYDIENNKPKEEQHWDEIVKIFNHIIDEAKTLELELIQANGAKYIINILSEKLNKIEEALQFALKCLDYSFKSMTALFLINDAIGRQLFYKTRIDDATPFIAKAVDINVKDIYTEKLDTLLVFSQILGIKDSKVAMFYAQKAKEFANENKFTSELLRSKVIGEYAISIYLNGDMKQAIYALEEGYQILLDSYDIKTEYHILVLRYGHILNYWQQILTKGKPPTKEMFGEEYAIPDRGMFLANYEDNLVEGIYFAERRFFGSILFHKSFESLNDFKMSRKWAYNNISTHLDIDFNNFSIVLSNSLVYQIIDYKYLEAAELQIKIIDSNNQSKNSEILPDRVLENKNLEKMLEGRPKSSITDYDETLVEFVLVPVILNYITRYSCERNLLQENIGLINDLIIEIESKFKEKEFVDAFKRNLAIIKINDDNIVKDLIENSESYHGNFQTSLMLVSYLFTSTCVSCVDALKFHFAIIYRLDNLLKQFSIGAYNYILIPFLENFWVNRIEKYRDEFSDLTFWHIKSKQFYNESKMENKVKNLFKILVHHLNYHTTTNEDDWLES